MEKSSTTNRVFDIVAVTQGGLSSAFTKKINQLKLASGKTRSKTSSRTAKSSAASYDERKEKRAWEVALAPIKSLPMQAFMLYMSGGGVQIFSIGIVFMLLLSPLKNIVGINQGMCLLITRVPRD